MNAPHPPVDKSAKPRRNRGKPLEIVVVVERVIREVGKPMTRSELVAALEARDIAIPAADKTRYVGTIMWRNQAKFRNIDGLGYWLNGEPWKGPSIA